jgi:hypothetical protein
MGSRDEIIQQINLAFQEVEYPGDWCLRGSNEGTEPFLLEREFKGKTDWGALSPAFLDQAPADYGSALSFFSDEAFRFYLPAYLIADIKGGLHRIDPVFHLCHGFGAELCDRPVNPRRYGARTWGQQAAHRMSVFNTQQCNAIFEYLLFRRKRDEDTIVHAMIDDAVLRFWSSRAAT